MVMVVLTCTQEGVRPTAVGHDTVSSETQEGGTLDLLARIMILADVHTRASWLLR